VIAAVQRSRSAVGGEQREPADARRVDRDVGDVPGPGLDRLHHLSGPIVGDELDRNAEAPRELRERSPETPLGSPVDGSLAARKIRPTTPITILNMVDLLPNKLTCRERAQRVSGQVQRLVGPRSSWLTIARSPHTHPAGSPAQTAPHRTGSA